MENFKQQLKFYFIDKRKIKNGRKFNKSLNIPFKNHDI